MPNWCSNTLTITHPDPAMIQRAVKAFAEGKFLNEFVPVPEDLHIVAGTVGSSDSPEQQDLIAQEEVNRAKYGYTNWYDFCVNEWGTKWDVGDEDGINEVTENSLTVYFDSAWAPPCGAYEKISDLGFDVKAMYYEPGMCFAGIWTTQGGDDYYEYSNMSVEEIVATLPKELDEAFDISEQVAEWQAEQEEAEE